LQRPEECKDAVHLEVHKSKMCDKTFDLVGSIKGNVHLVPPECNCYWGGFVKKVPLMLPMLYVTADSQLSIGIWLASLLALICANVQDSASYGKGSF